MRNVGHYALAIIISLFSGAASAADQMQWSMINVNATEKQGDAHLLKFPDGKTFLIDTGDKPEFILPFLKSQKILKLDKVFLTHLHRDHYGALMGIVDSGIKVQEIYLVFPDRANCDREIPWGCNWAEINELLKFIKGKKIPLMTPKAGDIFYKQSDISLEALYIFDGVHTPIGRTDLNDMSFIILLKTGKTRTLFTGDLNEPMGTYLAKNGKNLEAEILKVPHHGGLPVAPNAFFERVNPRVALVPAPLSIWGKDSGRRVRDLLKQRQIETYVNSLNGTVTVTYEKNSYKIQPEVAHGNDQ